MKKTKGIGPNNLGVSKAAVKNAYGDPAMTKKMGNTYSDSGSAMPQSKYYAMLAANMRENPGMSSEEAGIIAAEDIKKQK